MLFQCTMVDVLLDLLTFAASPHAAIGDRGQVLLSEHSKLHLHKDIRQVGEGAYFVENDTTLPVGVDSSCNKAISSMYIYIQAKQDDATTYRYNTKLDLLGEMEYCGQLCDALRPDVLVYQQKRAHDDYVLTLYDGDGDPVILTPPCGRKWKSQLSICRTNQHIAVVEAGTQSLDIFTHEGHHLKHQVLTYQPCGWKPVTAYRSNHMIVASIVQTPGATPYSQLHLHHLFDDQASRTKVLSMTNKHEVSVIRAIRYVEESDQLYAVYRRSGVAEVSIWCNIYKKFMSSVEKATPPPPPPRPPISPASRCELQ